MRVFSLVVRFRAWTLFDEYWKSFPSATALPSRSKARASEVPEFEVNAALGLEFQAETDAVRTNYSRTFRTSSTQKSVNTSQCGPEFDPEPNNLSPGDSARFSS
ncbi:hypothetical protein [Amycolatopsis benzoatilytica]|uniref:hypothetical protein n=1 Tax=Amycolatopsis benzoatilytica TaxID=346045 RepID=UPI00035C82B0|nr:hypothetical protein [Amycolatopsis benzoatilytica]